jgi:type I restriction enzyme S subunit
MIKYSKIKDICEITNGYAFKSDRYVTDEGARVIRITNVQKGKVVDNDPKLYPFSDLSNLDTYKIYEGDILMSLTGNVGRVGKFPKELLPAYINQRVCRVKSCSDNLLENYLFHFLNSDIFENDAIRNSAGAAQLNLSTKWVSEYEIPLPPLPQQQKIANILDAADALRQNDKALIAKYDELTQALFLDMFGDPVSNPMGWEMVTIRDLIIEAKYGTSSKASDIGALPYLRMNNITYDGYMDLRNLKYIDVSNDEKTKYLVKKGDIIFNRTNSKELVGKTGIISQDDEMIIAGYLIRMRTNENANPYYIWRHLNSDWAKSTLLNMCKSIVGMANINAQELQNIKILKAPIDLQNQFAERVAVIEEQKAIAQKSLEKSESLFNSLLQKAFKGELN